DGGDSLLRARLANAPRNGDNGWVPAFENSASILLQGNACIFHYDSRDLSAFQSHLRLLRERIEFSCFDQEAACSSAHCIEQVVMSIPTLTTYGDKHFVRNQLACVVAEG